MDRDRAENIVDPVERVSPPSGNDDTGTVGIESAEIHEQRRERGTEAGERPSEPDPVEPPSDEPPIPDAEDLPGTPRPGT